MERMATGKARAGVKFAYADPPYLGCCGLYNHEHGDDGLCWDEPLTHARLIRRLMAEFDGWALSASMPSLHVILPMTDRHTRVAAWVKTFCAFKKGVRPAYAWEPVLWRGGRNPPYFKHAPPLKGGKQNTPKDFTITEHSLCCVRCGDCLACRGDVHCQDGADHISPSSAVAEPITLKRGLTGAKPERFSLWVLQLLNAQPEDELVDLFPGSGAVGRAWESWRKAIA